MNAKRRRVPERVADMREAIENARRDLGALTKDQFLADGKTQRAVIESIIVIGEAAKSIMQLAPDLEHQHSHVWEHFKDVYGMRIILTHEYFRVDAGIIWDTVANDLPKLEQVLESLSPKA